MNKRGKACKGQTSLYPKGCEHNNNKIPHNNEAE